jgi:hypothetical protein
MIMNSAMVDGWHPVKISESPPVTTTIGVGVFLAMTAMVGDVRAWMRGEAEITGAWSPMTVQTSTAGLTLPSWSVPPTKIAYEYLEECSERLSCSEQRGWREHGFLEKDTQACPRQIKSWGGEVLNRKDGAVGAGEQIEEVDLVQCDDSGCYY